MTRRFSASSAAQLIACPGSANLELAIPGWQEPIRDDAAGAKGVGTRLHQALEFITSTDTWEIVHIAAFVDELAELHYRKRYELLDDPVKLEDWLYTGGVVPETYVNWFQALREFAPRYLRYLAEACRYMARSIEDLDPNKVEVLGEESVRATWLSESPWTTVDVVIVGPNHLEVFDYKTGSIPVDPWGNDQLLFYAASFLDRAPGVEEIHLHVLQPKNFTVATVTRAQLLEWMETAREAEAAILRKDLDLRPSGHCTFCPANPHSRGDRGTPLCPAMLDKLYPEVVDTASIFESP